MAGPRDLRGACAFVTGGSNGIGAATVRALAEAGARVMIGYHRGEDRARKLLSELPGKGHGILGIDLEDSRSTAAAGPVLRAAFGRLDVLVNCGGFTRPIAHGDLDALDDAFLDKMLVANVRGPFSTIRSCVPLMKESGDAVIVNVSSVSAFTGAGSSIAYVAAKAALDNISTALARVLGPNIRVMTVAPGAVATDFVAGRGREQLEKLAQAAPLKRVTEPEDVALAIMACITHMPQSTGGRVIVDAGRFLA